MLKDDRMCGFSVTGHWGKTYHNQVSRLIIIIFLEYKAPSILDKFYNFGFITYVAYKIKLTATITVAVKLGHDQIRLEVGLVLLGTRASPFWFTQNPEFIKLLWTVINWLTSRLGNLTKRKKIHFANLWLEWLMVLIIYVISALT